jgi:haloalkane dehalogenase
LSDLRLIAPSAYGDRRKLTPAIHAQYLAPFRDRWARESVLWALAKALDGSSDFHRSLVERSGALAHVPALVVWGMKDGAFKPPMLERWIEILPQAKTVQVSSAGHWPHEEEPASVLIALREFLELRPSRPIR